MSQLSGLSIEYRSGLFLGLVALVLSFVTGLLSGIGFTVILIRSLIMVPAFIAVGYGAMIVLKKYVPELYDVLSSMKKEYASEIEETGAGIYGSDDETYDSSGDINSYDGDEGYSEKEGDNFDRLNTINDSGLDDEFSGDAVNTSAGKMGKHVVVNESQFKGYEPSLMAEAVRTMMSKDKD